MTKKTPLESRVKKRPETKLVAMRIPVSLYEKVKTKAEKEGATVTAVMVAAFEQYLEGK